MAAHGKRTAKNCPTKQNFRLLSMKLADILQMTFPIWVKYSLRLKLYYLFDFSQKEKRQIDERKLTYIFCLNKLYQILKLFNNISVVQMMTIRPQYGILLLLADRF